MSVLRQIDALYKAMGEKPAPMALPDWRSMIKQHGPAGQHHLVLAKGVLDKENPLEVASHLVWWNGPFFIDVPDTVEFRAALSKVGKPFVHEDDDAKGRLFLSSLEIADAIPIMQAKSGSEIEIAVVQKPFAGFEDFAACLLDMKGKGYSEEVAQKICGKLQATQEKGEGSVVKSYLVKLLTKSGDDVPADERIIEGVVLEPETTDSQGDIYSAEEIRKACFLFMEEFGHFKIQHKGEFVDGALVTLTNWIVPASYDTVNAFGEDVTVKQGTWMHGARVNDMPLWDSVKNGDFTGWSMGGWSKFAKP